MVLKFEVNGTFCSREDDGDLMLGPGNFIDISRVLEMSFSKGRAYLSHKLV